MTAAELEAGNLLTADPARQLVPGEDFQLILQRRFLGAGLTAEHIENALSDSPDFYPIPNTVTFDASGNVVGVTVKIYHQPVHTTVRQAFDPIASKGALLYGTAWLQDQLTLKYVLPPASGKLPAIAATLVAGGQVATNPLTAGLGSLGLDLVGTFRGLVVLLVLVGVVVYFIRRRAAAA
jgi:hypothetical protein